MSRHAGENGESVPGPLRSGEDVEFVVNTVYGHGRTCSGSGKWRRLALNENSFSDDNIDCNLSDDDYDENGASNGDDASNGAGGSVSRVGGAAGDVREGAAAAGDDGATGPRPKYVPAINTEKKGRVCGRQPEKWKKNVAKNKHNLGQEYVSYGTKNVMQARNVGPPCCFEKIGREAIEEIVANFWAIGNYDAQNAYYKRGHKPSPQAISGRALALVHEHIRIYLSPRVTTPMPQPLTVTTWRLATASPCSRSTTWRGLTRARMMSTRCQSVFIAVFTWDNSIVFQPPETDVCSTCKKLNQEIKN